MTAIQKQPPPEPPVFQPSRAKRPWYRHKRTYIIAGVVLVGIIAGTSAVGSQNSKVAVPAASAPAAPATQAPATKAPATKAPATKAPATKAPATKAPATKAPATKAPATKAQLLQDQLARWASRTQGQNSALVTEFGNIQNESTQIVSDAQAEDKSATKSDASTLYSDAGTMMTDAEAARDNPPPASYATNWDTGMGSYVKAGQELQNAATDVQNRDFTGAMQELLIGNGDMDAGNDATQAIISQSQVNG